MESQPPDDAIYVVTDAEFDGPVVERNSMLSFASVAIDGNGNRHGTFEAVLEPLPGADSDPGTMAWFATHPEALAAATLNPEPPAKIMRRFVEWVRDLPAPAVFAAHPLILDGPWIDAYLKRFAGAHLVAGPREADPLFRHPSLCILSLAAGRLGWPQSRCRYDSYDPAWLGHTPHSHRAIDDAMGYANLLAFLLTGVPAGPPAGTCSTPPAGP